MDVFVASSAADYNLDVVRYQLPMKKGLECYLAERNNTKAVFVGTRRTDPHGKDLTHFDPTDSGWPEFMRIHPVIDWHYGMWQLLLGTSGVSAFMWDKNCMLDLSTYANTRLRAAEIWAVSSMQRSYVLPRIRPVIRN